MSITITAEKWIYAKLKNDVTLSGLAGGRIHAYVAPAETQVPFIVYRYESGMDENGMGGTRLLSRLMYSIKVIGGTESFPAIAAIADRIDVLLHGQSGVVSGGGEVISCVRAQPIALVEVLEGGTQYRHLGGVYEIQAG